MIAYILSNEDLSTKDILQISDYEFTEDIEYSEKSSITVGKVPNIVDDDFVLCMNEGETVFLGLCETYSSSNDTGYDISLIQKENFFDRSIFALDETIISRKGIEDFLKNEIDNNWFDDEDQLLSKTFLRDNGVSTVTCLTHTPISDTVNGIQVSLITENEVNAEYNYKKETQVYNFKEFLSSVREKYKIFLKFEFYKSTTEAGNPVKLRISIYQDTAVSLPIDTSVSDISEYDEQYDVDALAKLIVNWKTPDGSKGTDYDSLAYVGPGTMAAASSATNFRLGATNIEVDVMPNAYTNATIVSYTPSGGSITALCSLVEESSKHYAQFNSSIRAEYSIGDRILFYVAGVNTDEYDYSQTYDVGDYCTHSKTIYKCIIAVEEPMAWNADYWEVATTADVTCKVYINGRQLASGTINRTIATNFTWTLFNGTAFNGRFYYAEFSDSYIITNPIAEYSSSSTYSKGDYCTHNGNTYACSTAIQTAMAWNDSYWEQIMEFSSSSTYTTDNHCFHNEKIYKCKNEITSPMEWDDFYWDLRDDQKGVSNEIEASYNNNTNKYGIYNKGTSAFTAMTCNTGNIIGDTKKLKYYLLSDETISIDPTASTRMAGITESLYVESDSAPEMYQQVENKFESDSYEHKISFKLYNKSLIYPTTDYYVGRDSTIKTKTGMKTSIISSMTRSSDDAYTQFVFGKLKVSLIEKLRSK